MIKKNAADFDFDTIDTIECVVHPLVVPVMFEPAAMRYAPPNGRSARWSMPFNVAVGLLDGRLGLDSYTEERTRDAATLRLMRRVVPVEDATLRFPQDYWAWLRVRMANGHVIECTALKVRGSRDNPMESSDYVENFRRNLTRAAELRAAG